MVNNPFFFSLTNSKHIYFDFTRSLTIETTGAHCDCSKTPRITLPNIFCVVDDIMNNNNNNNNNNNKGYLYNIHIPTYLYIMYIIPNINTSINKDYKTPLLLVLPMCSLCSCENVWTDNSISSAIKNA